MKKITVLILFIVILIVLSVLIVRSQNPACVSDTQNVNPLLIEYMNCIQDCYDLYMDSNNALIDPNSFQICTQECLDQLPPMPPFLDMENEAKSILLEKDECFININK